MNINRPPLKSGPLTLAEMRDAKTCPPCNHNCSQRRNCPADRTDASKTERHMALMAQFWTAYLAILLVAACAAVAHFLPALNALFNF